MTPLDSCSNPTQSVICLETRRNIQNQSIKQLQVILRELRYILPLKAAFIPMIEKLLELTPAGSPQERLDRFLAELYKHKYYIIMTEDIRCLMLTLDVRSTWC